MLDQPSATDVTLHHVALYVSDLEVTRRFYRGALGMEEIARPADFTFPGAYFRLGSAEVHVVVETEAGRTAELRQQWSPDELKTGYTVHFALGVRDLQPILARLAKNDVRVAGGPRIRADHVEPWYIADPDGYIVELICHWTPTRRTCAATSLPNLVKASPWHPATEPDRCTGTRHEKGAGRSSTTCSTRRHRASQTGSGSARPCRRQGQCQSDSSRTRP
jgi:glyoxylase I family protein